MALDYIGVPADISLLQVKEDFRDASAAVRKLQVPVSLHMLMGRPTDVSRDHELTTIRRLLEEQLMRDVLRGGAL